eukprot:757251-Amphidinium_carterae.1
MEKSQFAESQANMDTETAMQAQRSDEKRCALHTCRSLCVWTSWRRNSLVAFNALLKSQEVEERNTAD